MKKVLLTGIAALFLATGTAQADDLFPARTVWQCGKTTVTWAVKSDNFSERPRSWFSYEITGIEKSNNKFGADDDGLYMNGKLCWPVEPVMCLRPDGTTENCMDRQTPFPRPRPEEAPPPVEIPKTIIYYDPGGLLHERTAEWKKLAEAGNDIEIRGTCLSGCTVVMMYVPQERICFGEGAELGFHAARNGITQKLSLETTQWMVSHYPQDIRIWLKDKGGAERMTVENFWMLHADELWKMGYRKCDPTWPEPMPVPVPMTIIKAGEYVFPPLSKDPWCSDPDQNPTLYFRCSEKPKS